MMEIEMYLAYTDHTWDTMMVSIKVPEFPIKNQTEWRTEIESRGVQKIQKLFGKSKAGGKTVAFYGLYWLPGA